MSKAVLRWQQNREPDLAGYRLYWSDSSDGTYAYLGPVERSVYAVTASAGSVKWYTVTAVDTDGLESIPSAPIAVEGLPANVTLPQTDGALGVLVTPQNQALHLKVTGTAPKTACWNLERAVDDGAVDDGDFIQLGVSPGNGLFHFREYIDNDVDPGSSYVYRMTSLNGELDEIAQEVTSPASPLDLPPRPPQVITADRYGSRAVIRWNPSADQAAAYSLYVRENSGSFQPVESSINGVTAEYSLSGDTVYFFAVAARDDDGREGELSAWAELSTWGSGLSRSSSGSNILLLINPVLNRAKGK